MALVRRAIGNRALTAVADLGRNIAELDRELASPGLHPPALPCTDSHEAAGMALTLAYIDGVHPFIWRGKLDYARKLAATIVAHRPS